MYGEYKMLGEKLVTSSPETYKTGPVTEDRPEHCYPKRAPSLLFIVWSTCWRHPLRSGSSRSSGSGLYPPSR